MGQMQDNENSTGHLEEIAARNEKLESIFLPHVWRGRGKFNTPVKQEFARFVHYTSAEAAVKIIEQKQVWMRSTACMTDYMEVQTGFNMMLSFFSNPTNKANFFKTIDKVAEGAAQEAIQKFDNLWQTGIIRFQTYIFCVSEHDSREDHHGRLSMWRAAGNRPRVAIVFKVPRESGAVAVLRINFAPVAYLSTDQSNKLIPEVIENLSKNEDFLKTLTREEIVNWIFHMLLLGATCLKHEGFHEEREWRAISCPMLFPSPLIRQSTETVNGVPQCVCKIPLNKDADTKLDDIDLSKIFDRLIIGPSQFPISMRDAFCIALSNAGVTEAGQKIFMSQIPIRT
jgi:hypothetical protein